MILTHLIAFFFGSLPPNVRGSASSTISRIFSSNNSSSVVSSATSQTSLVMRNSSSATSASVATSQLNKAGVKDE